MEDNPQLIIESPKTTIYAGVGGFHQWKEKLGCEPCEECYRLTEMRVVELGKRPILRISRSYVHRQTGYRFEGGNFDSMEVPFDESPRYLIRGIINNSQQDKGR